MVSSNQRCAKNNGDKRGYREVSIAAPDLSTTVIPMATQAAARRLTQADIARLAGVRRPVVTMWRKRYGSGEGAFPAARGIERGVEQFDCDEVLAWLRATGRGANEYAEDEAPLHTAPPIATPEAFVVTEALVVLGGITGETLGGRDADDIVALAEDADNEDRYLLSEIESAPEEDLVSLATYADAHLAASFGPLDALNRLDARAAVFGATSRQWRVSAPLRALVRDLAHALAGRHGGSAWCALVDPTGGGALLDAGTDGAWDGTVALPTAPLDGGQAGRDASAKVDGVDHVAEARATRASWRRLRAAGVDVAAANQPYPGEPLADAHVLVAAFPHEGREPVEAAELVIAIDEAVGMLDAHQCAIVIGPASALTDVLPDAPDGLATWTRMNMLRRGVLRAAIRLGPGGFTDRPGLHLALWVFGTARDYRTNPHLRTATADLTGRDLSNVGNDLVADVLAAFDDTPPRSVGVDASESESFHRVFRLVRHELTSDVLDEDRALVVRDSVGGATGVGLRADGRRAAERLAALVPELAAPLPGLRLSAVPVVDGNPGSMAAPTTVSELLAADPEEGRRLKLIAGIRLDPALVEGAETPSGHAVIGPAEVVGGAPAGQRRVDLLAFAAAHPNAQLTAPGDVVFTTSPRPGAWVDADGGSVVEFPARVLRVLDAHRPVRLQRILPRVLAADLAAMPGKQWKSALVRLIPVEHADELGRLLDAAAEARAAALERAAHLENLTDLLADGIAGGSITAALEPGAEEGH